MKYLAIVFASLLLISNLLWAEPDIQLYTESVDLGEVRVGQKISFRVPYLSAGNSHLYVYDVLNKNPAGPVSIRNIENTIESEFEGFLLVEIEITKPVDFSHNIVIITNSRSNPRLIIKGRAIIRMTPAEILQNLTRPAPTRKKGQPVQPAEPGQKKDCDCRQEYEI